MMPSLENLKRTPTGAVRIEAKAAYKNGQAMLTVYGFLDDNKFGARCVLHRVNVPRDTPKAEKYKTLRALCDLVAIQYGCGYKLRSKLPTNEGESKCHSTN